MPRTVVQVPVYLLLVGIATTVVSPIFALIASVKVAEANAQRLIDRQQAQEAEQRKEAANRYCDLLRTYVEVYEETPPQTPTGRNAQATWLAEYRRQGCEPPK